MKNEVLRNKIEEVMDVMDNFAFEHEENEKRALTLDQRDRELRGVEEKINKDKGAFEQDKIRLKAEREAVVKQAVSNAKVGEEIESGKKTLLTLSDRVKEAIAQEDKAKAEIELLEIKKKELGDLQLLREDLEKRERMIEKEKAIVRESKRILDIRREKIQAREHQLQMDAEIE